MKSAKPVLLLLDNVRNKLIRYVDGKAAERYDITNRENFDKSFNQGTVERARLGYLFLQR
ncbi:MAG TPA: hypothetical protein VFB93_18800 [Burkholderiales bacterium]|nr:hypothetical protein [Burkholderiales bacterium]